MGANESEDENGLDSGVEHEDTVSNASDDFKSQNASLKAQSSAHVHDSATEADDEATTQDSIETNDNWQSTTNIHIETDIGEDVIDAMTQTVETRASKRADSTTFSGETHQAFSEINSSQQSARATYVDYDIEEDTDNLNPEVEADNSKEHTYNMITDIADSPLDELDYGSASMEVTAPYLSGNDSSPQAMRAEDAENEVEENVYGVTPDLAMQPVYELANDSVGVQVTVQDLNEVNSSLHSE